MTRERRITASSVAFLRTAIAYAKKHRVDSVSLKVEWLEVLVDTYETAVAHGDELVRIAERRGSSVAENENARDEEDVEEHPRRGT